MKYIRKPNAPSLTRGKQNIVDTYISMLENPYGPKPQIRIPQWAVDYVRKNYAFSSKPQPRKVPELIPLQPHPNMKSDTKDIRRKLQKVEELEKIERKLQKIKHVKDIEKKLKIKEIEDRLKEIKKMPEMGDRVSIDIREIRQAKK